MIHKYLDSVCRIIVAELTSLARQVDKEEFVRNLTETDIIHRLGTPFGHLARYHTKRPDLRVQIQGVTLEVDVRFIRPSREYDDGHRRAPTWKQTLEKDYGYLFKALSIGRKGHFALVLCWPSKVPWTELAQIRGQGRSQVVNLEKLSFLPFLGCDPQHPEVAYIRSEEELPSQTVQTKYGPLELNAHRYGDNGDVINLAMLW